MLRGYVIQYPECILAEVEPAIELLRPLTDLRVVTLSDLPEQAPDFLVIPGGSCDGAIEHTGLQALIGEVKRKQGLLAGICNGALVLASAGVLKGERCTHTAVPKYAPLPEYRELLEVAGRLFDGSTYVDDDVVVSGRVITAKPRAARRFAEAIAERLGVVA